MACPKIWNETSTIFSRLPSAVPLWRHASTPDSWSGGESSCHGTLYSFWSWILQCLASELRHGCPGRIWQNMCVCFYVFFIFLSKGNIPRNIPAGIFEVMGISWNLIRMGGCQGIQPKYVDVRSEQERKHPAPCHVHPWFNLLLLSITWKITSMCNGQNWKQTYMANPSFVYIDKERADLFTAMFSLMLKGTPVSVTSWFINLTNTLCAGNTQFPRTIFRLGGKVAWLFYHDLFSTRPKNYEKRLRKKNQAVGWFFFLKGTPLEFSNNNDFPSSIFQASNELVKPLETARFPGFDHHGPEAVQRHWGEGFSGQ